MIAALGLALAVAAAPAAAPLEDPQVFAWKWSDKVADRDRTFRQAQYPTAASLPRLVVRADPAEPSRLVKLEYRTATGWAVESQVTTNARGVARLRPNPLCPGLVWCTGTYRYRVLVGGKATPFTITYVPR